MKKICILTASRAEYGLLRPLIKKFQAVELFDVRVVVTGMHLSPEFGLTYKEIEQDGTIIDEKIPILMSSDTPAGISKTMGLAMIGFGDYFERSKPDILVVLGDRYETLAVCCAALNAHIQIAHLYGGETTEGAVDEAYRHAITKMSYLHFTSTEPYRMRVIQLGESPDRVFTVGAMGIENALNTELLTKEELETSINFKLDREYVLVTYHPVTLDDNSAKEQCKTLLASIDSFKDMKFIFTKANSDADGRIINKLIEDYAAKHSNVIVFDSLGTKKYLSAIKYALLVMGNSSSGLIEVPSFGIPTINIGDRQKGRLQADSIINCKSDAEDIKMAIKKAMMPEFLAQTKKIVNPYGDGDTSMKIVATIKDFLMNNKINLMKKFHDIDIR